MRLLPFIGAALAFAACGDPQQTTVVASCIAGQSIACDGVGACPGVQVCKSDGTFDACVCPDASVPTDSGPPDSGPPDVGVDTGKEASVDATPDVVEASAPDAGPTGWGIPFGGSSTSSTCVAIDANKNVLVGGSGDAATLTKLDVNGLMIWQKWFGDVRAVVVDSTGASIVTATVTAGTDLGGGPLAASGVVIAKFDTNGVYQWKYGPFTSVYFRGLAARPNGNLVAVGMLQASVNLGSGTIAPNGLQDALLVELTSAGALVRAKQWGDGGSQSLDAVTLDSTGNIIVGGSAESSIDFGGGAMTGPSSGSGSHNVFIAKLDPNAAFLKQRSTGATGQDSVESLAVDATGRVLFNGGLRTTMNLGGATITAVAGVDIVLAALDTNLTEVWSKRYGTSGGQIANGLSPDPGGGFAIVGFSSGALSFGLGGLPSNQQFAYTARFDANGTPVSNYGWAGGGILNGIGYLTSSDFVVVGQCYAPFLQFPWGKMKCPANNGSGYAVRMSP